MSNQIAKFIIVALKLIGMSPYKVIEMVESIIKKMTGNLNFVTPSPTLLVVAAQKDDLKAAVADAMFGTKAAKALVKVKLRILILTMNTLRAYVQTVANTTPATAEQVVLSSGMLVKKPNTRGKTVFKVKMWKVSGQVKITCPKLKGEIMFNFKYTTTPDDVESFVAIGSMAKATRIISELKPATTYYFSYLAITKDGVMDWSDVMSFVVS